MPKGHAKPGKHSNSDTALPMFVEAYIKGGCRSATAAAKAIGWTTEKGDAKLAGSRLMKRAKETGLLQKRIDELRKSYDLEGAIQKLTDIAEGRHDMVALLREMALKSDYDGITMDTPGGGFVMSLAKARELGLTKFIRKLSHDKETGAPIIELESRAEAAKAVVLAEANAAQAIARVRAAADAPTQSNNLTIGQVMVQIPSGNVKELARKMLAQGRDEVIDAEAKTLDD